MVVSRAQILFVRRIKKRIFIILLQTHYGLFTFWVVVLSLNADEVLVTGWAHQNGQCALYKASSGALVLVYKKM